MAEEVKKKKKTVSFSQFTNWWTCPHKWYRDHILHEKTFEDNLNLCFGTAIHEVIQLYIKTYFNKGEAKANTINTTKYLTWVFKRELNFKKIKYKQAEFEEFLEDGKNILNEFIDPSNFLRHFRPDKWELLGIETELSEDLRNNVSLNAHLDMVFKEKATGNIRIIDFKTSSRGWNASNKEDFTKTSQLVLYKAIYSKKYNIPLNKIQVEFIILKRKLFENSRYQQSRIDVFKPSSFQSDVLQVIQEFGKFVDTCFTPTGEHRKEQSYPKIPGDRKKNCKYCPHLKNKKCDGIASPITL